MVERVMLPYIMVACAIAVVVSSRTVKVKDLQGIDEPEANGSRDFNYINDDTKAAAQTLLEFYTVAEASVKKYVEDLKTSNDALNAVREYNNEVEETADGTACEVPKEKKNQFTGAEENIEAIVETCAGSYPKDDFNNLNQTITGDLAKVQAIDNNIRLNSQICFSLRVPPSANCQKALKESLDRLKSVVTQDELSNLTNLSEQASEGAKNSIDQCVDSDTKSLLENLQQAIKAITDCESQQK